MRGPVDLFVVVFSAAAAAVAAVLAGVGEERVDVYVSAAILVYFVLALFFHEGLRAVRYKGVVDAALFMVFVAVVVYRLMQVVP